MRKLKNVSVGVVTFDCIEQKEAPSTGFAIGKDATHRLTLEFAKEDLHRVMIMKKANTSFMAKLCFEDGGYGKCLIRPHLVYGGKLHVVVYIFSEITELSENTFKKWNVGDVVMINDGHSAEMFVTTKVLAGVLTCYGFCDNGKLNPDKQKTIDISNKHLFSTHASYDLELLRGWKIFNKIKD